MSKIVIRLDRIVDSVMHTEEVKMEDQFSRETTVGVFRDLVNEDDKHGYVVITLDLAMRVLAWLEKPIDMLLHCPSCGKQHIDEPRGEWKNPPHRTHLCLYCGIKWRPAEVTTNGVGALWPKRGYPDTPEAAQAALKR